MIGRNYVDPYDNPVVVLCRWSGATPRPVVPPPGLELHITTRRSAPRNVLIRYLADGSIDVVPCPRRPGRAGTVTG